MSWSVYVNAKTPEAARKHVMALQEPTPEHNWGTPPAAKALVLAAIDLAAITTEGVGVKIEAAGHSPNGNCTVKVEPFAFIE